MAISDAINNAHIEESCQLNYGHSYLSFMQNVSKLETGIPPE